jgi:hypothetical protein
MEDKLYGFKASICENMRFTVDSVYRDIIYKKSTKRNTTEEESSSESTKGQKRKTSFDEDDSKRSKRSKYESDDDMEDVDDDDDYEDMEDVDDDEDYEDIGSEDTAYEEDDEDYEDDEDNEDNAYNSNGGEQSEKQRIEHEVDVWIRKIGFVSALTELYKKYYPDRTVKSGKLNINEVKHLYKKVIVHIHPDKNMHIDIESPERMKTDYLTQVLIGEYTKWKKKFN